MTTILKSQETRNSSPDLIEQNSEVTSSTGVSTVSEGLSGESHGNNNNSGGSKQENKQVGPESVVTSGGPSVAGVSDEISRSVPNMLDHTTNGDGMDVRGLSLVKKQLLSNNLTYVLKAPWKSLKNLSFDRLARWKNQYDLRDAPVSNSRGFDSIFGGQETSNKPSRRLGFGRLTHWKNHYDLREATQDFDSTHFSAATYKFLEVRSMPDHRVVDSSSEYLDTPGTEVNDDELSDSTTPAISSRDPSDSEV